MTGPARGIEGPRPGPARADGGMQPLDGHFAFSTTAQRHVHYGDRRWRSHHGCDPHGCGRTAVMGMVSAVDRRRVAVLRPSDHQRPLRHGSRRGRANHGHDPHRRHVRRKLGALQSAETSPRPALRRSVCGIRPEDHEGLFSDRGRRRRPQQWRHDPYGRDGAGHGAVEVMGALHPVARQPVRHGVDLRHPDLGRQRLRRVWFPGVDGRPGRGRLACFAPDRRVVQRGGQTPRSCPGRC